MAKLDRDHESPLLLEPGDGQTLRGRRNRIPRVAWVFGCCCLVGFLLFFWRPFDRSSTTRTFCPIAYEVVPGFFASDEPDYVWHGNERRLGLLDDSPDGWSRLDKALKLLNKNADADTAYKLLYLARHGEGLHNIAEQQYGTDAWNCRWAALNGSDGLVWGPDAPLSHLGVQQAEQVQEIYQAQVAQGMPLPSVWYSSPLRRARQTLHYSWHGLRTPHQQPWIQEALREKTGIHTCDARESTATIQLESPGWHLDNEAPLYDELWCWFWSLAPLRFIDTLLEAPEFMECDASVARRIQRWLNHCFATDDSLVISVTAHSGVIDAFNKVLGRKRIAVGVAGVLPTMSALLPLKLGTH